MSGKTTKRMLDMYRQDAPVPSFFSRMFVATARSMFNTDAIEIDIQRSGEKVAVVISDLSTGARFTSLDQFTNKEFKPPILGEGFVINKFQLLNRMGGDHPFASVEFQSKANQLVMENSREVEEMIRRHIELQCAQILQTGTLSLVDEKGNVAYVLDFKAKATHFPTSAIAWDQAGATRLADLEALGDVNRVDGKRTSDQLIFGSAAWNNFINSDEVKEALDNRRISIGNVVGGTDMGDGKNNGTLTIGPYQYELWTYDGRYDDPANNDVSTPYMDPAKVIVRSSSGRMDAAFGAVPSLVAPEQRVLKYLPPRLSVTGAGGIDLYPNAWVTEDGSVLKASLQARPLMIPVAIDTYGCLDTGL
jgi:hypothetical protein